ncbi:MAG: DUF4268 domain-containing protein [Candidatus Nanopelagicales bacterium]
MSAREAWPHEAADFTPWLLANASELGDVLEMDLELSEAEHGVGNFSLDLIGRDGSTGERVIVENQLTRSDHSHLGQLLTYAAGTDAVTIVWIAEELRFEHRAALDWLNERTDEFTRFFGVEVSAIRVDNSRLAPLLDVVVTPNDWQKAVRLQAAASALSPMQSVYREFWEIFLANLQEQNPGWTNAKKPQRQQWMNLPAGVSVINYAVVVGRESIRVEIYFSSSDGQVNEENFNRLLSHKGEIEERFGAPMVWDPLPGRKACRISYSRVGDIADQAAWPEYSQWFVDTASRLREAIKSLGGMPKLIR